MKPLKLGGNDVFFHYGIAFNSIVNKSGQEINIKKPKATDVEIITKYGEILKGSAVCSDKDICSKEKGRKIALSRALKTSSMLSRDEKAQLWNDYRNLKPGGRW